MIVAQENYYSVEVWKIKAEIRNIKMRKLEERVRDLKDNLHPPLQRAVDIASEKGASTWLSILPIEKHGFFLS